MLMNGKSCLSPYIVHLLALMMEKIERRVHTGECSDNASNLLGMGINLQTVERL